MAYHNMLFTLLSTGGTGTGTDLDKLRFSAGGITLRTHQVVLVRALALAAITCSAGVGFAASS